MAKHKIKNQKSDYLYMGIVYLFLTLFTLLVLYPIIYIISCSFSSPSALVAGKVFLWPVHFSLLGYQTVLKTAQVWVGYKNSIIYTTIYTILSVFITMLAAFPLSRKEFPARGFITWMFAITMFISGGIIPNYILVDRLGLMNSMWSLILPGLVSAWSLIITRTFLSSSLPEELFEAASIDGSNYFQYFFKVVIPLSKPIMAFLALSAASGMWNSYFSALLYISDTARYPLQIILRNILIQNVVDYTAIGSMPNVKDMMQRQYLSELLKYALIIISSIPLLLLYPLIQKYFIKGVMIGSIKG